MRAEGKVGTMVTKTGIFLLILVLSYSYGIPCSAEGSRPEFGTEGAKREWVREKQSELKNNASHARRRAGQALDAAQDAEAAAAACDWGKYQRAVEEARKRLASARKHLASAKAVMEELLSFLEYQLSELGDETTAIPTWEVLGPLDTIKGEMAGTENNIKSTEEALRRAEEDMKKCRKPVLRSIWEGLLDLKVTGVGTTTGLACVLTNKTDTPMEIVIPTGTQLTTTAKGFQPYQTGYNPPIALGPRETVTKEIVALCTDNSLAPAPKDDPSVTYTMPEGPPTPQQEKITELIVTTNQLRKIYSSMGPVAEPDDFIVAGGPPPVTVPMPLEVPKRLPYGPPDFIILQEPEPEVYGPPEKDPYDEEWEPAPPPKPRTPEEEKLRERWKKELDEWMKKHGPPPPPEKPKPEEDEFAPLPPPDDYWQQRDRLGPFESFIANVWQYVSGDRGPLAPEPAPPEVFEVPPGTIVLPPDVILLSLSGPLEFPGTTQFTLAEVPELKTNISSRKEKGEAVFSNPTGKVEVSMAPTEDPEIVKFNITKLEARSPSFEALGKSRGDINMALNSPEKSTGTLNIKTGEVRGTVSVKAWGEKYKELLPAAASYTGKFDVPTKKLSLNLRGTSFEPVEIPQGAYEKANPEKFWESVQLYTIWRETNKIGKKELSKLMGEQFKEKYPAKKARKLGEQVAEEIIGRVDKVYESHKELKEEGIDFSTLDPTLKWRKT